MLIYATCKGLVRLSYNATFLTGIYSRHCFQSRLCPHTSSHSFFLITHLVFDVGVRCKQANHAICFFWRCERLRTRLKMTLKSKFCQQSSWRYSLRLCGNFRKTAQLSWQTPWPSILSSIASLILVSITVFDSTVCCNLKLTKFQKKLRQYHVILSRTSELTATSSLAVTSLHGPFFFFGGRSIHDTHSLFFQPLYNGTHSQITLTILHSTEYWLHC